MRKKDQKDQIIDQGDLHKYYIEIPNLIDDLDLSLIEFRLYVHLKRVTGAEGGKCWKGSRALAIACKMSDFAIRKARAGLVTKNLITIQEGDHKKGEPDTITLIDIWPQNMARYSKEEPASLNRTPAIDARTPASLNLTPAIVNRRPAIDARTEEEPCKNNHEEEPEDPILLAQERESKSDDSLPDKIPSPQKPESDPPEEKPKQKREPSSYQLLLESFAKLRRLNMNIYKWARLAKDHVSYTQIGTTVEQVEKFDRYWYSNDYRGIDGRPPTLDQIGQLWDTAQAWEESPAIVAPSPTISTNGHGPKKKESQYESTSQRNVRLLRENLGIPEGGSDKAIDITFESRLLAEPTRKR